MRLSRTVEGLCHISACSLTHFLHLKTKKPSRRNPGWRPITAGRLFRELLKTIWPHHKLSPRLRHFSKLVWFNVSQKKKRCSRLCGHKWWDGFQFPEEQWTKSSTVHSNVQYRDVSEKKLLFINIIYVYTS